MSDLQTIQNTLERAVRRRRWQRAWRALWQGLLLGASLWLVALMVYKVAPISFQIVSASGLAAVGCAVLGFFYGWLRPLSAAETARWIDGSQNLKERLSTALEIAGKKTSDESWRDLLLSDAARHAQTIDPKKILPFSLTAATRWGLVVLALGVGLGFVPEYRSKAYVQKEKEKAIVKEVGKQIESFARRTLEQRPPALPETKQSLENIEQLGEQLAKIPLTRSDALKDLASVTEKIKDQIKELGKNPALRQLERNTRESSRTASSANSEMQKQIDSLQKSLGDKGGNPEALDKLKKDLEKAKQAAAGLPDKDSPEGASARQQLAQTLAELSRQMRELGQETANLDQAIAALQANQTDLFMKDLNASLKDLEKMQEMAKMLQQLQQQAASKLGKDLAEQLKNGQPEAAQQSLAKMIDQLKSANLTPEQLKKIMEEVAKAIEPGSQYGKVGDLLKQAAGQMQKGEKPDAAQSLAAASKELEKLMQQMGDAQELMASLDSLKKAQFCVGNCEGWGECKSMSLSFKPGGKPNRGVGTWADEDQTGWFIPEISKEMWDNSVVQRPDMDPRGQSDRGDAQINDALVPTKVRGQISPGGPMPSVTLKGVSIKGQSTVEFKETAAAAQSEAQSAINQDQVPRAYKGAVRDYFDDLKK